MVNKILGQVVTYKMNKESYTVDERAEIKRQLRENLRRVMDDLGNKLVDGIDSVNRQ